MSIAMKTAISIIIPVYNAENTIDLCLSSILKQDFPHFEIIVIDDGSTDRTFQLVQQKQTEDERIRCFCQKNNGVSSARNQGLKQAKGKYVMFVDGDDYLLEGYLSSFYNSIESTHADVVIGGCTKHDIAEGNNTIVVLDKIGNISDDIWYYLSLGKPVYGYVCSKIIRRQLLENNNIYFDENMYSQEDLKFYLSVYACSETIYAINNTDYIYMYRPSNREPAVMDYIQNKLLINYYSQKNRHDETIKRNISKSIAGFVFGSLYYADDSGDIDRAIQQLTQIDGLNNIFANQKIVDEKTYVTKLLLNKRLTLLKFHFKIRKIIKKILAR